jgi:uncharacterized protein (DUF2235 family)
MKNIVICCDGTGNEISENISNVLKLYRTLRKTEKTMPRQMAFYDPGVGTLARSNPWTKLVQDASAIFGLATGYGLDDNVLDSYEFIVDNYADGDAIYLFGFSRGAYTVRMLAGLIHKIGLISKQQVNLAGSGLTAYKQFSSDTPQPDGGLDLAQFTDGGAANPGPASKADQAAQYARILSVRWPTIKFVGVWDTVASVIVPRPDRLYLPSLQVLAFVHRNPSIEIFRHAISIDEKRRLFRLQRWEEGGKFWPSRFAPKDKWKDQDSLQVWFAGVHADIGGGYPEIQSALSKYPLLWMIEEAVKCGLKVDRRTVNQRLRQAGFPARSPQSGVRRLATAQLDERRLARARVFAEKGQVQGMEGAKINARILHPGCRAARDSGRRLDPRIRDREDRERPELQAGEYPKELSDHSDADRPGRAGGGCRGRGRRVARSDCVRDGL